MISQLPRPTMAERTETSVTLSMARLAKATGGSQVHVVLHPYVLAAARYHSFHPQNIFIGRGAGPLMSLQRRARHIGWGAHGGPLN